MFCYVNQPTSCTDALVGVLGMYSADACRIRKFRICGLNINVGNERKISSFYLILFIATMIILVLWPNEGEKKLCLSSESYSNIPNQAACQYLCEQNTACVGISYRPPSCYVCFNDKFKSAVFASNVYFFRRPGK